MPPFKLVSTSTHTLQYKQKAVEGMELDKERQINNLIIFIWHSIKLVMSIPNIVHDFSTEVASRPSLQGNSTSGIL